MCWAASSADSAASDATVCAAAMPFVLSSVTTGSWRADCFRGSLASAVGRGRWSTYSTTGARKQTSSTHRAHWTRSRIRWQVTLGSSLKSVAILMRASSFARLLEKTSRQPESNKVVRLEPQTKASGRRAERLRRRRRPPLNGRSGVPVVPIPAASRAPLAQVHATPRDETFRQRFGVWVGCSGRAPDRTRGQGTGAEGAELASGMDRLHRTLLQKQETALQGACSVA